MELPSTQTATGLPWKLRHDDARLATAIAQQHGVSELVANILVGRKIALEDVPLFLSPTLRDSLPDPFHLMDMDKAVARIIQALHEHQPIAVFGDYDVDGATSTALLMHYLGAVGAKVTAYIPDRMTEGYGPNIEAFKKLIERESKLIITVDCGTLSYEPIAYAQSAGVDVIVLDHHLSSGALPNACAIVNPNRVDESSPHTNLAAVGVTFLTLVALNSKLKAQGFFGDATYKDKQEVPRPRLVSPALPESPEAGCAIPPEIPDRARDDGHHFSDGLSPPDAGKNKPALPQPNLLALLDMVALGTVCDVMPLTGLNRAFVSQGLKVMGQRRNPGLARLADVARMDEAPNVYHLGFLLGPRINAGGRVGKSSLGVELLTATDESEIQNLATTLDLHNQERQAIEAQVSEQAFALASNQENLPVIMVSGEGWHQGVIGIVAGRLKERYSRPAIVLSIENGVAKASARSVHGVDMGAAVHAAVTLKLIASGGGHAMAAGFTTGAARLSDLHRFLLERMGPDVAAYTDARVTRHDGMLSVSGANPETLDDIARAGPFGLGNPSPRFVIPNARILHLAVMKEKHIRVTLGDDSGAARLNAVAFHAIGSVLGNWLLSEKTLHLLGELKANRWQGEESVQFLIEDAARPS